MTTQQDEMRELPRPDRYVECGEVRPLPMYHLSTLLQYAEREVQAATAAHSEALAAVTRERDALREDAARLDFMETHPSMFELGRRWYWRVGYGQPFRRADTLRAAIDAARTPPTHPAAAPGDKEES